MRSVGEGALRAFKVVLPHAPSPHVRVTHEVPCRDSHRDSVQRSVEVYSGRNSCALARFGKLTKIQISSESARSPLANTSFPALQLYLNTAAYRLVAARCAAFAPRLCLRFLNEPLIVCRYNCKASILAVWRLCIPGYC